MTTLSGTNRRIGLLQRVERALIGGGFDFGRTEEARTFPAHQRDIFEERLIELLQELGAK